MHRLVILEVISNFIFEIKKLLGTLGMEPLVDLQSSKFPQLAFESSIL